MYTLRSNLNKLRRTNFYLKKRYQGSPPFHCMHNRILSPFTAIRKETKRGFLMFSAVRSKRGTELGSICNHPSQDAFKANIHAGRLSSVFFSDDSLELASSIVVCNFNNFLAIWTRDRISCTRIYCSAMITTCAAGVTNSTGSYAIVLRNTVKFAVLFLLASFNNCLQQRIL